MGFISASRRILFENENIMRGFNGKAPLELPEELMTKEEKESFKKTGKSRSFSVMNGLNQFYWDKEEKETPEEVKTEDKEEITETPVEKKEEKETPEEKKEEKDNFTAKYETLKVLAEKIIDMGKSTVNMSVAPMIKDYNNLSSAAKKKAIGELIRKFILDTSTRYRVSDVVELSSSITKITNQVCKKSYKDFLKFFKLELSLLDDNVIAKEIIKYVDLELNVFNTYNKLAFYELFIKSINIAKFAINDKNIDSLISILQSAIDKIAVNVDAKDVFKDLSKSIKPFIDDNNKETEGDATFEAENGVIMMTNEEIDSIAEDMEEVLHGIKESALEEEDQ